MLNQTHFKFNPAEYTLKEVISAVSCACGHKIATGYVVAHADAAGKQDDEVILGSVCIEKYQDLAHVTAAIKALKPVSARAQKQAVIKAFITALPALSAAAGREIRPLWLHQTGWSLTQKLERITDQLWSMQHAGQLTADQGQLFDAAIEAKKK